jgi:hypothetical protein
MDPRLNGALMTAAKLPAPEAAPMDGAGWIGETESDLAESATKREA